MRIQFNDSMTDAIMKLSEHNPGALTVCMKLVETSRLQNLAGLGLLLQLDEKEIYGEKIWMLYKDDCGMNIEKMKEYLRRPKQ